MVAAASILVIVLVVLTVARIGTVALIATGLPFEVAKFQARSALTGVGFTTGESESVVAHPVRRRIVMTLMVVGNAGLITIVASVMLSFVNSGGTGDVLARLAIIAIGLTAIGLFTRTRLFERRFTNLVARVVQRFSDIELRDFHHLLQLSSDYAVTEMLVQDHDWLAGRTLAGLGLPEEGVLVLAVQRSDGSFVGAPRGNTVIHPNDVVMLYGRASVLSDLDVRPATPRGRHEACRGRCRAAGDHGRGGCRGRPIGRCTGEIRGIGWQVPDNPDVIQLWHSSSTHDTLSSRPPEDLETIAAEAGWFWVDVVSPTMEEIALVGQTLNIGVHDLDDVIDPTEQPKMEDRGDYIFVITHTASTDEQRFRTIEIGCFLGRGWVVTFHAEPSPVFESLAAAAQAEPTGGPDMILALTLDTVGRRLLALVNGLDRAIDDLEDQALTGEADVLGRVQSLRRDALRLRSVVRPQQDAMRDLSRLESNLVRPISRTRFSSTFDDYLRIAESLDTARMLLASVLDTYRGTVAERMNEVMKVLTVFSAIILPLSLLAGIYGMNFENMRELGWDWAYYALLGVMAVVAIGLWSYFAKRGFIGRPPRVDQVVTRGLGGMVNLTLAPARGLIHLIATGAHADHEDAEQ